MKSNSINIDNLIKDLDEAQIKELKTKITAKEQSIKLDTTEITDILDKLDAEAKSLQDEEFVIDLKLKLKPMLTKPRGSDYGWSSERIQEFEVKVLNENRNLKKMIEENYSPMCLEVLPAINATRKFKKLRTLQNQLDTVIRAAYNNDKSGKYQVYTEFLNNRYANERDY